MKNANTEQRTGTRRGGGEKKTREKKENGVTDKYKKKH